jgi:hypothetical protein
MNGGMWIKSGANTKRVTTTMIMHIMNKKTNPPLMIPIHAMGRPDSFRLRIWLKEIIPNISARIASRKLIG